MLQKINSYKEREFLVFQFEDGSKVKYNLSNGETIGKRGKVVGSLQNQLKGYSITDLIGTFPDENYRNFLSYVNKKQNQSRFGGRRFSNINTLLSWIKHHSQAEQYFACGIKNVEDTRYHISEVPKGYIKLAKEYGIPIKYGLIKEYSESPDYFNLVIPMECVSLTLEDKIYLLTGSYYDYNLRERVAFVKGFVEGFKYKLKSLMTYLDNLVTYEGLSPRNIINELKDYCRMMSELSPKFEKYPHHFLTTHRIAVRNYERLKQHFDEEKFNQVRDTKLEATFDDFIIIYPKSTQEIKDEAVQQANCVASYVEGVIAGRQHILFGRYKLTPETSVLTIQVIDYRVVQVKGKHNRDITEKEQIIINQYNQKLAKFVKWREKENLNDSIDNNE